MTACANTPSFLCWTSNPRDKCMFTRQTLHQLSFILTPILFYMYCMWRGKNSQDVIRRTTIENWFSPSILWAPQMKKLQSASLVASTLYLLIHFPPHHPFSFCRAAVPVGWATCSKYESQNKKCIQSAMSLIPR